MRAEIRNACPLWNACRPRRYTWRDTPHRTLVPSPGLMVFAGLVEKGSGIRAGRSVLSGKRQSQTISRQPSWNVNWDAWRACRWHCVMQRGYGCDGILDGADASWACSVQKDMGYLRRGCFEKQYSMSIGDTRVDI